MAAAEGRRGFRRRRGCRGGGRVWGALVGRSFVLAFLACWYCSIKRRGSKGIREENVGEAFRL